MESLYFVDNFIRNYTNEDGKHVYSKGMLILSKEPPSNEKSLPNKLIYTGSRNVCHILDSSGNYQKYIWNIEGKFYDKDEHGYVVLYPLDYINVNITLARSCDSLVSILIPGKEKITLLDVLEYEKRTNTLNYSKYFRLKRCICIVDPYFGEDEDEDDDEIEKEKQKILRGVEEFSEYEMSKEHNSIVLCQNEKELQKFLSWTSEV